MNIGYASIFQNPDNALDDAGLYRSELNLATLAPDLGFDSLWATEHHFTGYEICPDVVQHLSYLAGRCPGVDLGSMVLVLPWHDPVRVAETVCVLDHYTGGRVRVGFGRGAAPTEFRGYRVPMSESRARFVAYADTILRALETGVIEADHPLLQVPRLELRPRPLRSFRDRVWGAAISPESMAVLLELGLGVLVTPQKPWVEVGDELRDYEARFATRHGRPPSAPVVLAFVYCEADAASAERNARRYFAGHAASAVQHYELLGERYAAGQGYDHYHKVSNSLAAEGPQGFIDGFMDMQIWGDPAQCLAHARHIAATTRCGDLVLVFRFADMPFDVAERSMLLFAEEVLPALRALGTT
jgi:alkanesulfonate monooxygenase SsuD/methylene tetrahydromethanopterin reductase-like flavin-dependent oxidoreductase (luciferase family)